MMSHETTRSLRAALAERLADTRSVFAWRALAEYGSPRKRETVIRGKRHRLRRAAHRLTAKAAETRRRIRHAWDILTTGDC